MERCDVIIFGAGVAGLYLLNVLRDNGYNAVLFEKDKIGGIQTINSQGILHRGVKYSFFGKNSNIYKAAAKLWDKDLMGLGKVDLRKVDILSNKTHLILRGTGKGLKYKVLKRFDNIYESLVPFQDGKVLDLPDKVIDMPSLVETLANKYIKYIYKLDSMKVHNISGKIRKINVNGVDVAANLYVFTCGEGNKQVAEELGIKFETQVRPVNQVYVAYDRAPSLYGHIFDGFWSTKPSITVTTHYDSNHQTVYNLGGEIAERDTKSFLRMADAVRSVKGFFPMDLKLTGIGTFSINRAEIENEGKLPHSHYTLYKYNYLLSFPHKLVLTPLLVDTIYGFVMSDYEPKYKDKFHKLFERPEFAKPFWSR